MIPNLRPMMLADLAVLGEDTPITEGVRLLFLPAFHEGLCVVVQDQRGRIVLHRITRESQEALYSERGRFLNPCLEDILPVDHPVSEAPLTAAALTAIRAAVALLPETDTVASGPWRDGMSVRCEVVGPGPGGPVRVFGEDYPLGDGPPGHGALARAVLHAAAQAFPQEREYVQPLLGYSGLTS